LLFAVVVVVVVYVEQVVVAAEFSKGLHWSFQLCCCCYYCVVSVDPVVVCSVEIYILGKKNYFSESNYGRCRLKGSQLMVNQSDNGTTFIQIYKSQITLSYPT
jgi:hypothetical protein